MWTAARTAVRNTIRAAFGTFVSLCGLLMAVPMAAVIGTLVVFYVLLLVPVLKRLDGCPYGCR